MHEKTVNKTQVIILAAKLDIGTSVYTFMGYPWEMNVGLLCQVNIEKGGGIKCDPYSALVRHQRVQYPLLNQPRAQKPATECLMTD